MCAGDGNAPGKCLNSAKIVSAWDPVNLGENSGMLYDLWGIVGCGAFISNSEVMYSALVNALKESAELLLKTSV